MCERRGELRSRKEFDYTVSTYPNEPHHVNIVQPSRHCSSKEHPGSCIPFKCILRKKKTERKKKQSALLNSFIPTGQTTMAHYPGITVVSCLED